LHTAPEVFGPENRRFSKPKPEVLAMSSYETISVECYSGYKANERPVAFIFRDRRREVAEILDRWYEGGTRPGRPEVNYFKVKTTDGEVFLLRYLSLFDAWTVRIDE
jgi:hypothetical protein